MSQSGLTVRQHERKGLNLDAELAVDLSHQVQVRFNPTSSARDPHTTTGKALDISPGGMGLVCSQFLPRMCEGTVRVFGLEPVSAKPDGSPVYEVVFEHRVKVRRVTLETHEPSYALGMAFIDPIPDIDKHVAELLKMAKISEISEIEDSDA